MEPGLSYLAFWLSGSSTWVKNFNSFFMTPKVLSFTRSTRHWSVWGIAAYANSLSISGEASPECTPKSFAMETVGALRCEAT